MRRRILLGAAAVLAVTLVGIQFVPVERTNPPVTDPISAPPRVEEILRRACFDCHSNETSWPWYSHVAPASWKVADDVEEARSHMNFSTWGNLQPKQRRGLISEIWEEVSEGAMPLALYRTAHPRARLDDEDLAILESWARTSGGGEAHEHGGDLEHGE
jgi:hypothetical protein